MRTTGVVVVAAALAAATTVGAVPGALAHETGRHEGFVSTVSGIQPPLPGLRVHVIGAHEQLSVRNWTQKTVVLFDERGGVAARLAPGEARAWADPRIDWKGPPPERDGLVRNWRVRGEADGERFEIVGFLGYAAPAADPAEGSGLPSWAIVAAVAGGVLLVAAAVVLPLLRRETAPEA